MPKVPPRRADMVQVTSRERPARSLRGAGAAVVSAVGVALLLSSGGALPPHDSDVVVLASVSLSSNPATAPAGALFNVAGLTPGHQVQQCVAITSDVSTHDVRLDAEGVTGALAPWLVLTVTAGTGAASDCADFVPLPGAIFRGNLPDLAAAGSEGQGAPTGWAPTAGDSRTFRLTVDVIDDARAVGGAAGTDLLWRVQPGPTSEPTPISSQPPPVLGGPSTGTTPPVPAVTVTPTAGAVTPQPTGVRPTPDSSSTTQPATTSSSPQPSHLTDPTTPATGTSPTTTGTGTGSAATPAAAASSTRPSPTPRGSGTRPHAAGNRPQSGAPAPRPATAHSSTTAAAPPAGDRRIRDLLAGLARNASFPLLLILAVLFFLLLQDRLDRKDPKLALAPLHQEPEQPFPPTGATTWSPT